MNNEKITEILLELLLENKKTNIKNNIENTGELFVTGKQYFIRTVTFHALGVCKDIIDGFILLDNAMMVMYSGRLGDALKNGIDKQESSELEPINGILHININSIVDFTEYSPKLIVIQKWT